MLKFIETSQTMQGFLISLLYIALCSSIFSLIYRLIRSPNLRIFVSMAVLPFYLSVELLYCIYLRFSLSGSIENPLPFSNTLYRLPYGLYLITTVFAFVWSMLQLWKEQKIRKKSVTFYSIHKAINDLPVGLCFAKMNGIPLLVNHKMYDLSQELTDSPFQNAENLWNTLLFLREKRQSCVLADYPLPTFRCKDGKIIQFSRMILFYDETPYIQITVSDISTLHNLSEELKRSNEELKNWHLRLKHLSDNIVKIKHEEEILNSKIHIHNQLGHCILKTQSYLLHRHPAEESEMITMWNEVATKMKTILFDEKDRFDNPLEQLYLAAESVGCHIEIDGELPNNRDIAYLILSAIRESVTNAVLHGEADKVFVRIDKTKTSIDVSIKNNSRKKLTSLSEGGGLSNLRRKIETFGGKMEIKIVNHSFELSLSL